MTDSGWPGGVVDTHAHFFPADLSAPPVGADLHPPDGRWKRLRASVRAAL